MGSVGFVQAVKSRDKYYFYVRRAFREEKKVKKKNIFALGQREKALETIEQWLNNKADLPEVMQRYSQEDILRFKKYIEEKI